MSVRVPQEATLPLAGDQSAPSKARRWAVNVLADWGFARPGDVALVVSELCTNAVVHVGEPFEIGLCRLDDKVRVQVWDCSRTPPTAHTPAANETSGRGLHLVGALATWGWEETPGGKLVWAELRG